MNTKLIIFDMDGVLFDSVKLVNDLFMLTYPTMTQDIMDEILCGNFHEQLEKFKLTNKPIDETAEEKEARIAAYTKQKKETPLFKGILELLTELHIAGITQVINTSAFKKNCVPLLDYAGIRHLFDFVATKEVSTSKVEKFKIIQEKYKIPKQKILFITDTLGDIIEAETADVRTIAVTYGAHKRTHFTRTKHKNLLAIVDSVKELGEAIRKC
jgi:phosphoglycolate phosphatase-like HAD superfamily hydrolase